MDLNKRVEIRIDEETDRALESAVKKAGGDIKRATVARIALKKGLGLKK